jgi:hypothetical protein
MIDVDVQHGSELIKNMISFYNSLSEQDRRKYAAVEAFQEHDW